MKNILITGASGLIGTRLSEILFQKGYKVRHLSRKYKININFPIYLWDPKKKLIDIRSIEKLHSIINLAGEPLSTKKWTIQQKIKILESRSESIDILWKCIKNFKFQPKCFITSSGINYYGSITQYKAFTEKNSSGKDFLAKVCQICENNADLFKKIGIRTIKLRTGVVLSKNGGFLNKMEKIIKYYLGSPLGNGKQFISWIHIDDLCYLYIKAIEDNTWEGSYNAVSPERITNLEFMKILSKILNRPLLLPNIPKFILNIFYGKEFSNFLLNGSPISVQKILNKGFIFRYPKLKQALKKIYK